MLKKDFYIRVVAIVLCFVLTISSICFATSAEPRDDDTTPPVVDDEEAPTGGSNGDLGQQFQQEISDFNSGDGAYAVILEIAGYMLYIALVVGIFKTIQIGIKFMTGVGSKRQEAKAALIPWLIGVIVCVLFISIGSTIIQRLTSGVETNIFNM